MCVRPTWAPTKKPQYSPACTGGVNAILQVLSNRSFQTLPKEFNWIEIWWRTLAYDLHHCHIHQTIQWPLWKHLRLLLPSTLCSTLVTPLYFENCFFGHDLFLTFTELQCSAIDLNPEYILYHIYHINLIMKPKYLKVEVSSASADFSVERTGGKYPPPLS